MPDPARGNSLHFCHLAKKIAGEVNKVNAVVEQGAASHDVNVMGGGTLLDNGIHLIDLTRYFLGEVAKVQGVATGRIWHFPSCEDNGFALLQSPTGQVASLQA